MILRWLILLLLLAPIAAAQPVGPIPYSALPNCADTGGQHLNVNSSTGAISCGTSTSGGSGTVTGPGSSTVGHFATWNNTGGTSLADGGAPAASATTDTTNASNISSGTLAAARGGAGTVTGALKGNGAGTVSQAACADLSNGAASCSTDTTNASNISSGTLNIARLPTTIVDSKCVTFDSTTSVTAQTIEYAVPWTSYTVTKMLSAVSGGGSYTVAAKIGATNITGLSAVSVSGTTNTSTNATAANTGSANDQINIVISSPSGTVNQSYVCLVFQHSAN